MTNAFPLGCSAFCLRNDSNLCVARNLDVPFTNGFILTNPRGIDKKSVVEGDPSPLHWISRFGSLTVNLLGADFPMGGINEKGLLIEHLWMPGTIYPDPRGLGTLLEFEWIQFMLDTCTSVTNVLEQMQHVAILPGRVEMHFLLADESNACALLEFRDAKPLVYRGSSFQPPVVTNSWYDESVLYASRFEGTGGHEPLPPDSVESLDRFTRLARAMAQGNAKAMDLLDCVMDSTLLSAVYQPSRKDLIFKSCKNADLRILRLTNFDVSPGSPRMMLNLHAATDAIKPFNAREMVATMQEVFSTDDDFLCLNAYASTMIARQTQAVASR